MRKLLEHISIVCITYNSLLYTKYAEDKRPI